jgi:hypothetical protein
VLRHHRHAAGEFGAVGPVEGGGAAVALHRDGLRHAVGDASDAPLGLRRPAAGRSRQQEQQQPEAGGLARRHRRPR